MISIVGDGRPIVGLQAVQKVLHRSFMLRIRKQLRRVLCRDF
jgi:hypothetical protein